LSLAEGFLRKVRSSAIDLIGHGNACLAALSGGPDSVAMTAALAELAPELGLELSVAHLDHAIRDESAEEADWVATFADHMELPFVSERIDVPELRAAGKLTLEEAARRARYEFLERAAEVWGVPFVAMGHTADDQAETVLFRIIRGTGLAGLAGMPRHRPLSTGAAQVELVRPMLDCSREEVLAFLTERGLDFLTDESNFDVEHQARARIRHQLLPLLESEHNPDVRSALLRLAERAEEVNEMVVLSACKRIAEYFGELPEDVEEIAVPLELLEGPQAVRVELLRLVASHLSGGILLDRARLAEAARGLIDARVGRQFEFGGPVAVRDYDHVVLRSVRRDAPHPSSWRLAVEAPGETPLPEGLLRAELLSPRELDMDEFSLTKTAYEEVFDAALLESGAELICRTRRPGDRFHPLGALGECKLKDFFINEKVPQAQRDQVPLLVLGEAIIWVVGYRLSEIARVGSEAQELIRLDFVPARALT
jgi:tRNA(Ile)-lysidine synthase